jgi:hypothetical protein
MRYLATCVARKKRIFGTDPKLMVRGIPSLALANVSHLAI